MEGTTIEDEMRAHGISVDDIGLLWLDVEGHELEAMRGAPTLLDKNIPLFIEMNTNVYGQLETANFLRDLQACGYRKAFIFSKEIRGKIEAPPENIVEYLPADVLFI